MSSTVTPLVVFKTGIDDAFMRDAPLGVCDKRTGKCGSSVGMYWAFRIRHSVRA